MSNFKGTPGQGLFGATLGFFIGFASVALFGPTAARFKDVMDLSPVLIGWLVAVPALSGSLLRIPFAAWTDTTGGRKPFLVLLTLSLLGMAGLTAVSTWLYPDHLVHAHYFLVLGLGVLCGCGIATFSVGVGQVSYWFPQKQQGRVLGTYAGVGNLAPGVFSLLMPLALSRWGLGGSYLAWMAFLGIGLALYFSRGRNAWYFQARESGLPPETAREAARNAGQELFPAGTAVKSLGLSARTWKTWALVGIYFTTFGGFIALTAWLPIYWREFFGASALRAGALTAGYSILTSLLRVAGGRTADRFGGEGTLLSALAVTFFGALVLTGADGFSAAILGTMVLALGMGVANAAVFKLVPQEVPQAVGGAAGWVGGLGAFGGFAIPPALGAFVARYGRPGYATGFVVFLALAAVSIALALLLKTSRGNQSVVVPLKSPIPES